MALNFMPKLSALSIILVMVLAMATFPVRASRKSKETQLSFYFQDISTGVDRNSASVGRVQGSSMTSGLDGRNALVLLSIVFTDKKHNGSTLEIQGTSKQFEEIRELSVVSGSGKFRFVRGYTTFETVVVDLPNSYAFMFFFAVRVLHAIKCFGL
ncbi:dirigent protein 1-like [Malus domestica]|uniref:dirigent protein 1-like n=1 Tax=Malus domestica TaxID=3750 RepID=UPI000498A8FF|nr:dirigent protein 1-like [Malus domestica]